MSSKEPRYEITEIKAFPGTESKAITSKQQEGWELVSQQHGRVRTTLSFRRQKPPVPWKMWATVGGVGVILGSIITVGALLEDDAPSAAENTATSSTEQPSLAGLEDDPTSVPDLTVCETGPLTRSCKFGQTAVYSDTVRGGEVKLEITVGEPVEFTPSEAASVALDRPIQPVNVYFPITIRNLSPALPESTLFLTQASNAQQPGDHGGVEELSDGDVESYAVGRAASLPAGETLSVKEGWTMATIEGAEYRIRIDGLAGYGITFTR